MADVTIDNSVAASHQTRWLSPRALVWTGVDTGYLFYVDSGNQTIVYCKTTDGGATWASAVTVYAASTPIQGADLWFDKWTDGDTGSIIHLIYMDETDTYYHSLDTSSDTLSTRVDIGASGVSAGLDDVVCTITKSRGGTLTSIFAQDGSSTNVAIESTNGGSTWDALTSPVESTATNDVDYLQLLPGGGADPDDLVAVYFDVSASACSVKAYDHSADSWSETAVATSIGSAFIDLPSSMSATTRHSDGAVLIAIWGENTVSGQADVTVYEWDGSTVTQRTDVISDGSARRHAIIAINQQTDDIYVYYTTGAIGSQDWKYKISANGGSSWGAAQDVSDTADTHLAGYIAPSINSDGGQMVICWYNEDLNDLLTNTANAIEISAAGGQIISPASIPSGAAFGVPSITKTIETSSLASGGAIGGPSFAKSISMASLESGASLGSPDLAKQVSITSITSGGAFGAPSLAKDVAIASITSGAAFGVPDLAKIITPVAIPSGEAFGAPSLAKALAIGSVASGGTIGALTLSKSIGVASIPSGGGIGAPIVTVASGDVYHLVTFEAVIIEPAMTASSVQVEPPHTPETIQIEPAITAESVEIQE